PPPDQLWPRQAPWAARRRTPAFGAGGFFGTEVTGKRLQEIKVMKRLMSLGDDSADGPFSGEPAFAGPFSENPIRVVERFSAADLHDVFEGNILAFVVRNYLDPAVCEYAAIRIMQNAQMDFYEVEKVRRHFDTFHDLFENPARADPYFNGAPDAMNDLRQI